MTRSIVPFDPQTMSSQGTAPGWMADEHGLLSHPALGVRLVRVMIADAGRILYDQILHAERGGGVFLPVDRTGRIGLLRMWRPQTRDQARYAASFPDIDLALLGRISYEAPRGFGEKGEAGLRTAVREAEEETHGEVSGVLPLGELCDNTTFSPHVAAAAWGRVAPSTSGGKDDAMEGILGKLEFFTRAELADLRRDGVLYDGLTLAAIALLWIQHPDLFESRPGA